MLASVRSTTLTPMNRNIDIGGVISEVFETYRDQAAALLPAALVVFGIEGILSGLLVSITPILVVAAVIIQIIATYLYQGMVVQLVADVQDGRRDASVGDLFRSVTPVLGPLIAAGLLAGLGIGIGFILLIVPGLFLLTIWSLVSPVVVLERPGIIPAFTRSRELVRGNGWQVLGVIIVFFLILVVLNAILGAIGNAFGSVGSVVADIVASVLAAPLVGLAGAVLYFHVRRVKGEIGPAGSGAVAGQAGAAQPGVGGPGAGTGVPGGRAEPAPGGVASPGRPPQSPQSPGGGPQSPSGPRSPGGGPEEPPGGSSPPPPPPSRGA